MSPAELLTEYSISPGQLLSGTDVGENGAAGAAGLVTRETDASSPDDSKKSEQKKTYARVDVPSAEQIMQEDFMNNCAVRTGLSAVMGLGLGAMFGIAMGTFDTAVCLSLDLLGLETNHNQIRQG